MVAEMGIGRGRSGLLPELGVYWFAALLLSGCGYAWNFPRGWEEDEEVGRRSPSVLICFTKEVVNIPNIQHRNEFFVYMK